MAFKKTITHPGFWKSVLVLGLIFAIIYGILDLFFSFGFDLNAYSEAYFSSTERVIRFLMALVLGGFVYGFIITYFKFNRKLKELEKRQRP